MTSQATGQRWQMIEQPRFPHLYGLTKAEAYELLKCKHRFSDRYTDTLYYFICDRIKNIPNHGLDQRYVVAAKRVTAQKVLCSIQEFKLNETKWRVNQLAQLECMKFNSLNMMARSSKYSNQIIQQLQYLACNGITGAQSGDLKAELATLLADLGPAGERQVRPYTTMIDVILWKKNMFDSLGEFEKKAHAQLDQLQVRFNKLENQMEIAEVKIIDAVIDKRKKQELMNQLQNEIENINGQIGKIEDQCKNMRFICGIDVEIIKKRFDLPRIIAMNYRSYLIHTGFQPGLMEPDRKRLDKWKSGVKDAFSQRVKYVFYKSNVPEVQIQQVDDDESQDSDLKADENDRVAELTGQSVSTGSKALSSHSTEIVDLSSDSSDDDPLMILVHQKYDNDDITITGQVAGKIKDKEDSSSSGNLKRRRRKSRHESSSSRSLRSRGSRDSSDLKPSPSSSRLEKSRERRSPNRRELRSSHREHDRERRHKRDSSRERRRGDRRDRHDRDSKDYRDRRRY